MLTAMVVLPEPAQASTKILLSGNKKKIVEWRENQSHKKTKEKRPDLLDD